MKTQFVIVLCAILMLVGGVTPFAAPLDPDLVIYFDYEEFKGDVVTDKSGRGHGGTINGKVAQVDGGKFGKAGKFEQGSFLDLDGPNIPKEDIPTGGMSIVAWINVEAISDMAIFNARAGDATWLVHPEARGGGNYRWLLRGAGGTGIFDIRAGKNKANEWVHYAGTYDQKRKPGAILFINGVAVGEDNSTGIKIAPDWDMGARVGYNIDNARPFTGLMDELNIWKRGLSEDEVKAIMDNGVADFLAVDAKGKLATQWGQIKSSHR